MAIPARISVAGDLVLGDIARIAATGIIAKRNALIVIAILEYSFWISVKPNTIATATPKHAPEDTPVVYASARGLFMTLCIATPATANEAPASNANRDLGSL